MQVTRGISKRILHIRIQRWMFQSNFPYFCGNIFRCQLQFPVVPRFPFDASKLKLAPTGTLEKKQRATTVVENDGYNRLQFLNLGSSSWFEGHQSHLCTNLEGITLLSSHITWNHHPGWPGWYKYLWDTAWNRLSFFSTILLLAQSQNVVDHSLGYTPRLKNNWL